MITSSLVKERDEVNIDATVEATSDIADKVVSLPDLDNATVTKCDTKGGFPVSVIGDVLKYIKA